MGAQGVVAPLCLLLCLGFPAVSSAQLVSPPPVAALTPPSVATVPDAEETPRRFEGLTEVNLYLPDGEFDFRFQRLVRNVLFDSQVRYKFVKGDISAFLRYKYYARTFTYKIGVFDSIEFDSIGQDVSEFDRVRGSFFLFERPVDYWTRWLILVQNDDLAFGNVLFPDHDQGNFYTKMALQFGSPFDGRLNAIAGESRSRTPRVLTAHRELGPQKTSAVVAVTHGWTGVGDYDYTKIEAEGLKEFDFGNPFLVTRLHMGVVPQKHRREGNAPSGDPLYSIPIYELFQIGGRDALKGTASDVRGTDEIHISNELFIPIFIARDYAMKSVHWTTLYTIAYVGTGNIGFDRKIFTDISDWVVDAGVGVEATVHVGRYDFLLTALYAETVRARDLLDDRSFQVSFRKMR